MSVPSRNVPDDQMLFNNQPIQIIDVWEDNFIEEIQKIAELIPRYNYIAMVSPFSTWKCFFPELLARVRKLLALNSYETCD